MRADPVLPPADETCGPFALQRAKLLGRRHVDAALGGVLADRDRERVLAARLERRQALQNLALVVPREWSHLQHAGTTVRERPGLVEGEGTNPRRRLEKQPALDQHAVPSRGGQASDDRYRRRDDERARATMTRSTRAR